MANWKRRRLAYRDYAQTGYYFITICCKKKENYFWKNDVYIGGDIQLTREGIIAKEEIERLTEKYSNMRVDKYVIMPNHIHIIIEIIKQGTDIPTAINQTKGKITRRIGYSPWQISFHDHIIRGDDDYRNIWNYIDVNPLKWNEDKFYFKIM